MSGIGEKIRERRIELNITQEELASRMGYKSKSSINKIELGLSDIPQSKIKKFADVLGTTPSYLMGWTKINEGDTPEMIADSIYSTALKSVHLKMYNELSDENKQEVNGLIRYLHLKQYGPT